MLINKLVNDKTTCIRYVYHISDIHIRNEGRHEEYLEVFGRLYDKIKSESKGQKNSSIIVITGDVVHTKTHHVPVVTEMVDNFFANLLKLLPVILIAGNHDKPVDDPNKLDILTVVVNRLPKPNNMYYIKERGFYQYHNIVFGYSDMHDPNPLTIKELEGFENVKDKYLIALYHGIVHGSKTDANRKLTSEKFRVSDFKGYNYGFFGDIHKFQYLNSSKTIAYAGSLIQQCHGETLNNHGVLKWNLVDGTSSMIQIENDYGFCDIVVDNGKLIDDIPIPKNPSIRLIIENTTEKQLSKIESKLRLKYPGCIVKTKTAVVNSIVNPILVNSNYVEYIDKYLSEKYTDSKKIKKIKKLHTEICGSAVHDKKIIQSSGEKWEIIELKFSNMFSFGENNVVNFEHFSKNQIIGIFAPNHYGKSAILDIILYCLFQKCSRGKAEDIMHSNKKSMECSLKFRIGNNIYLIERTCNRCPLKMSPTTKFTINDEEQKNDAKKLISEKVGSYNDYVTSYFCTQDKEGDFFRKTNRDKKIYMNEILKLNLFEGYHDTAKKKLKDIDTDLKAIIKQMGLFKIDDVTKEISELKAKLKQSKSDLTKQTALLELSKMSKPKLPTKVVYYDISDNQNIDDVINEVKQKLENNSTNQDVTSLRKELQILTNKKNETKTLIANLNKKINKKSRLIQTVTETNEEKNIANYEKSLKNNQKQIRKLCAIKDSSNVDVIDESDKKVALALSNLNTETICNINKVITLTNNNKSIKILEKWLENCNNRQEELEKKIQAEYCDLKQINTDITILEKDNAILLEKIDNAKKLVENFNRITESNKLHQSLIDKYTTKVKVLEEDLDKIKNKISSVEEDLSKNKESSNNNKKLNNLLDKMYLHKLSNESYELQKKKYDRIDKDVRDQKDLIRDLTNTINNIESNLSKLTKIKKEYKDLETEKYEKTSAIDIYNSYIEMVNVNGLPHNILTTVLPSIELSVNNILRDISDFEIQFEYYGATRTDEETTKKYNNQKKLGDIDVYIKRPTQKSYSILIASGFEKFIASIALRVALCSISTSSKPNLFVIDEGWSCLDSKNISNADKIMSFIKNQFDHVILISHLDQIKEQARYNIQIGRKANISYVNNK